MRLTIGNTTEPISQTVTASGVTLRACSLATVELHLTRDDLTRLLEVVDRVRFGAPILVDADDLEELDDVPGTLVPRDAA